MNAEATEDLQAAWQELLQRRAQLLEDPKLAGLGLRLIQELGNAPAHRGVLRDLAQAWEADWRLSLVAASMLVEQAGRRGMDEP
ncbi:MAG: hypothetical protein WBN60_09165, partial [Polyangiales bacterium]